MKPLAFVLAVTLAACGSDSKSGGGGSADAPSAPAMVTFSGTVTSKGLSSNPLSGVTVGAYTDTGTTPVAMATTDASGMFTMMVPTGGVALQGYVKASISGYLDTYLYPPTAVTADETGLTVYMVTADTLNILSSNLCHDQQQTTKGVIGLEVLDASMAKVAGATVSSSPAAMSDCYNSNNTPSSSMHVTDTDGIGYLINVPAGTVSVTATKSGLTFASHQLNARAGALTLTIVQP